MWYMIYWTACSISNVFVELFKPIIATLQFIQDTNRTILSSAALLLSAIEKYIFVIFLLVCENWLSFTLPLSHYLQNPNRDLLSAINYAKYIREKLKYLQNKKSFSSIFKETMKLEKKYFDIEIKISRIAIT